jgi:peptidase C39-like protein
VASGATVTTFSESLPKSANRRVRARRRRTGWLASFGTLLVLILVQTSAVPVAALDSTPIHFQRFDSQLQLTAGQASGTWTLPPVEPGFAFTRLVASWNADTPAAGRITVDAQVTTTAGETSDWYTLGIWAASDASVQRTSVSGQSDGLGRVATDTLYARADPFASYRLRVRLERQAVDDPSPTVRSMGASVSDFTYVAGQATSAPLSSQPVELYVPPLSQEIHARQYPQWGGGGEAWCSPTSTEMVVEFWGRGPSADDLSWVDPRYADPGVDYAARSAYDAAYRGTGNWPFNAAYAGRFGLDSFVTQLRSLAEAEQFVRAGIPLVASIASRPGELDGFLFSGGTSGHLVVIAGFDAAGNPIVYDPAAWSDSSVRRVYDRAQFERVWLRGSGGTVYVIHPPEVPLPPVSPDATPNW